MILNEDRFLNEAFNNIPDWLKQYLAVQNRLSTLSSRVRQNLPRNSRNINNYGREGIMKYDGKAFTVEPGLFSNRKINDLRGHENKYTGDMSLTAGLANSLRAAGIDLSRMEVIGTEKPQRVGDDRLKEPNIPIFLLFDGRYPTSISDGICQAYAKGINDDDICTFSYDKQGKRLGTLPMKFLLDKCIAFAYLDSSNTNNFMDDAEIDRRIERDKDEPYNSPNERLPKSVLNDVIGTGYSSDYKQHHYIDGDRNNFSYNRVKVDKSGYAKPIAPANIDDYSGGSGTWYSKFRYPEKQRQYDKIKEQSITNVDDIVDMYNGLVDEYKNTLRYSSWLNSTGKDISKQRINNLRAVEEKIKELKTRINSLKETKAKVKDIYGDESATFSVNWEINSILKDCYDLSKEIKSILNIYNNPDSEDEYSDYADLDWD